jgi:hypothetical protein
MFDGDIVDFFDKNGISGAAFLHQNQIPVD